MQLNKKLKYNLMWGSSIIVLALGLMLFFRYINTLKNRPTGQAFSTIVIVTVRATVTASATATANASATATAKATATATVTPPIYSDAIVITVQRPTRTPTPTLVPTAEPGPLSGYSLEEVAQFTEWPPYQLQGWQWTADGQYLFIYGLEQFKFPNPAIALYPINQAPTFKGEALPMVMLPSTVIDTGFYRPPIKRPRYLDYFFYLETISDNHFKLWLSNYEGSEQHLVTEMDTPHYGVSDDGYVVYLHDNTLHLINPTFSQPQADSVATTPFEPIEIDITDRYFGIFPSPQGKYVALVDDFGRFYTINFVAQAITDLSISSDYTIYYLNWDPDGTTMVYKQGSSFKQIQLDNLQQEHIIIQKADGSEKQQIQYSTTATGRQISVSRPQWSPDGHLIVAWVYRSSYCYEDCDERVILISADGQYVKPIPKMYHTALGGWSADGKYISVMCGDEQYVANLCIFKLVKK